MTEWIEKLRQWMAESDNMVFFGGAGVSTESGIPDFRSVDGLYHQKFQYPPETILSHSFYVRHKAEFYDFYRAKMLAPWAQPNAAHRKLAQWEQEGKLKAVITQNIDGLHQKAVDVLGNDSFEAPLLLPLGQFPVGRIGLRIQNQHLIAVKTIKFLRIHHEKSVA